MTEPQEAVNAKFILTLITIIAIAIGAVLWAVNSHADLKEWAAGQDYVTRTELKEVMEKQYVPRTDFVRLETKLEEAQNFNRRILESLDELKEKVDSMKKRH